MRKALLIIEEYENRGLNQEQIADKYNIPKGIVGRVTKMAGFNHGTKITPENKNYYNKNAASAIYKFDDMSFLDKYDF